MRIITMLCLLTLCCSGLLAQQQMQIGPLFGKDFQKQQEVTEVIVTGKKLKPYNLTLFRSITLRDRPHEMARMEQLVKADGATAADKEVALIGGKLYFGFYRFQDGDTNRYIFYRNQSLRAPHKQEATLVYMEGKASLAEIKEMFK